MHSIDLNADVGEGAAWEEVLVPLVSSVNIACGAHAGDEKTMAATMALATQHGVAVGAHPGFADRENFGRRDIVLSTAELEDLVTTQLYTLKEFGAFSYVKPHGALYTMAARDPAVAQAVVKAIQTYDSRLILMGLAGGQLVKAGEKSGLVVVREAFADRRYEPNGQLRSRGLEGAMIGAEEEAVAQVIGIVEQKKVTSMGGVAVRVDADSICLHGDNEQTVAFARRLRSALADAGIVVRSFIR